MSRPFAYAILVLIVCVFLFSVGLMLPLEILVYLGTGWAFFLARVLPGVTIDRGGVAIAGVCLVLLAALAHSFFGWLHAQANGTKWEARWTASLVAGVVLMFAAGISAAGMAHQAGWLLTSKERWVEISGSAREPARRSQSVNNLKQIMLGVANYESSEGSYPPGATLDVQGRLLHGWQTRLLPYLQQQALYDQINFKLPWDDPRNQAAFRTPMPPYLNPGVRSDPEGPGPAPSHYSGNARVLGGDSARKLYEISDGISNTILAGEAGAEFKPWGHPANWRDPAKGINRSTEGFGSPFPGGANFVFADGSVKFLKNTIDPKVFRALGTPAGSEAIGVDAY